MVRSGENDAGVRVLGLGNEILGDDAFGILVARRLEGQCGGDTDIVCSSASGFALLDHLLGVKRLIIVDIVTTRSSPPGTIYFVESGPVPAQSAAATHFLGLWDVLAFARKAGLPAPLETTIVAVEADDCRTVGGRMHPAVEAAIAPVVEALRKLLGAGVYA